MSKDFTVTILGTSSAIPTRDRYPTSQVVNAYGRYYLLDCGEGTQIQLRKYKISFQRIDRIFISHLHADHFLGLPGLLSTMDLLGRTKEIHIHAFEELEIFMNGYVEATFTQFNFPIHMHYMDKKQPQMVFENDHIQIKTFPVKHRVPCNAFLFREKPKKFNVKKEAIQKYGLTIEQIQKLKNGELPELKSKATLEELTASPAASKSYAFVTDTLYNEKILDHIKDVDVLYHESTFAEDLLGRAKDTMHSTASQAGMIAMKANVKKLVLGHYSVRYEDLDVLLNEARTNFENTVCSVEGMVLEI
jgi:ribonuclease Z